MLLEITCCGRCVEIEMERADNSNGMGLMNVTVKVKWKDWWKIMRRLLVI